MAGLKSIGLRYAVAAAALVVAANADAKAKAIQDIKVEVDGKPFKVVRYDDNTVMVVQRTLSRRVDQGFRDRSRQAVFKATGCVMVDELLDTFNAHYTGKLDCSADTGSRPPTVGTGDRP